MLCEGVFNVREKVCCVCKSDWIIAGIKFFLNFLLSTRESMLKMISSVMCQ